MTAAAAGKNLWIVGGGELAGQFYDQGLLDELFVQVGSVTLGAGKPLLPRAITSPPLRLVSVRAVGTGFAELHYEVPRPSPKVNGPARPELPTRGLLVARGHSTCA
jgi:dihydrofolate reductase